LDGGSSRLDRMAPAARAQLVSRLLPPVREHAAADGRPLVGLAAPLRDGVQRLHDALGPVETWSLLVLLLLPALRWWVLGVLLLFLAFELYRWWVVRVPGSRRHAPLSVLFAYPIYGALNTVLRTASLPVWVYLRFVSGAMRPRRSALDRVPA